MEKDTEKTPVIFLVDIDEDPAFKGEVYALFIQKTYNNVLYGNRLVDSYVHVGQHSSADWEYCLSKDKRATPEEYKALFEELESIGYNLFVL